MNRLHVTALVVLIAGTWGITLTLHGMALTAQLLTPFSLVVGVVTLITVLFDKWFWAWRIWRGWFVKRPDLRGTWKASFHSNYVFPDGTPCSPSVAYMAVRQTYSTLSMRQHSVESSSELLGSEIVCAKDGTFEVVGVYRNEPDLSVEHRSPIHRGGLLLRVEGEPVNKLTGRYWTDRTFKVEDREQNTLGTLKLTERKKEITFSYEQAKALFEDTPS